MRAHPDAADGASGVKRCGPVLIVCGDAKQKDLYVTGLRALGVLAFGVDTRDALLELTSNVEFTAVIVDINRNADWWVLVQLAALHRPTPLVPIARPAADGRRFREFAFSLGCQGFVAKPTTVERLRDLIARLNHGNAKVEVPSAPIH
jgi:DNA-binding NtrC family response regulator